jgi:serine/threonine-protein kinase
VEIYLKRKPDAGGTYFDISRNVNGRIGRYEINQRVDGGGNGVVHVCTDELSGYEYAVKFQLQLSDQRRQRFNRELELFQHADHNHLIRFVDAGVTAGKSCSVEPVDSKLVRKTNGEVQIPFVVMELASNNLKNALKQSKPQREDYLGQFRGLSEGLGVLHDHALHRDIKPSNILVIGDRWVISDYGLCSFLNDHQAPLTLDGERTAPIDWMSPEQENKRLLIGGELTAASDVYQLAMIFWFVVTGERIEGQPNPQDWNGPPGLLKPILKALSINPLERQTNGKSFAEELGDAIFSNG